MARLTPHADPRHSTPDWSLSPTAFLDPAFFVSPPFSISSPIPNWLFGVLTLPAARNIPFGRVSLWFRIPDWSHAQFRFRIQPHVPLYLNTTHYYLRFSSSRDARLARVLEGAATFIGTWPFRSTDDAWQQYRITWTHACSSQALPLLHVRLEVTAGPNQADYGILTDTAPLWASEPTNRIGFEGSVFDPAHMDDLILEQYS